MLTPNSIPPRPSAAARAEACGRRAPPPQIRCAVRRCSIFARARVQLDHEPRTPASATKRFDPEPTVPTSRLGSPAQASRRSSCSRLPARAKNSAGPPVRIVVRRASGKSRSHPGGDRLRRHGDRPSRRLTSARPVRSATSRSARRSTSPAPSVTTTSPSASRRRKHRLAPRRASEATRPGGRRRGRRSASATSLPVTPASSPSGRSRAGIDVEHHDDVGARERAAELAVQVQRARVQVRLEDRDQALRLERARGLQRGAHLGRMVRVVVEDAHPAALSPQLEAPAGRLGSRPASAPPARGRSPPARRRRARRARSARCDGPEPAAAPRRPRSPERQSSKPTPPAVGTQRPRSEMGSPGRRAGLVEHVVGDRADALGHERAQLGPVPDHGAAALRHARQEARKACSSSSSEP